MIASTPAADRFVEASDNRPPLITTNDLASGYNVSTLLALENKASSCPIEINDVATYGVWQDTIADIATEIKHIEAHRKDVKAPYLQACGTVGAFYKDLEARAIAATSTITTVCTAYMRRIRDEERKRREEEAKRLREEEDRKRKEADIKAEEARKLAEANKPKKAETKQAQAEDAEREARSLAQTAFAAEQSANVKSADLSRTRSSTGTLGSLKDEWKFEVLDIEDVKGAPIWPFIKREHKEQAIRAYMKANAPANLPPTEEWQPLKGVRFYRTDSLQVRR